MTDDLSHSDLYGHAHEGTQLTQTPIGMDAMVASPTTFTQAVHLGEFQAQQAAGMTSLTHHDAEMALMHAENAVKTAMANGATREEAIAAAGHYANGNPELASIVQDAAGKQYDANKNPLAAAAGEGAAVTHTLAAMLGVGVTAEAEREAYHDLVLPDHKRPVDENGKMLSTGALMAQLQQFSPEAGLPALKREQGRSMSA